MPFYPKKSITLLECLIAMVLIAVIILAINNVSVFTRYQLLSSDRRAKLQNDVSLALEHIIKQSSQAIGNEVLYGTDSVVYTTANTLSVFVDLDANALREPGIDVWVRYKLDTGTHKLNYCNRCPDAACASCPVAEEWIANNITAFTATKDFSKGNYVNIGITACYNAALTCNTLDNPTITMNSTIPLNAISNS